MLLIEEVIKDKKESNQCKRRYQMYLGVHKVQKLKKNLNGNVQKFQ